jgi:hypothetical protein
MSATKQTIKCRVTCSALQPAGKSPSDTNIDTGQHGSNIGRGYWLDHFSGRKMPCLADSASSDAIVSLDGNPLWSHANSNSSHRRPLRAAL